MKIRSLLTTVLVATLCLSGCSKAGEKPATSDDGKKAPQIAGIFYSATGFVAAQEKGMNDAVKPLGGSVKIFAGEFNPQKQQQQCLDAASSGRYNVLVIGADATVGPVCAKAAKAAKIPLIALDLAIGKDPLSIKPDVPGETASIILSAQTNADDIAELVKGACEGKDPCNVIATLPNDPDPFTQTAIDEASKQSNVKIVNTFVTNFDSTKVTSTLPDILTAHPDTNVFLATDDESALAGAGVIDKAGLSNKIKIIGNGGSQKGVAAVKAGKIYGTIANVPRSEGQLAGKLAIKLANGEKISPNYYDALKLSKIGIITKDNADQFTAQWN